jgi:hypothetical protein
LPEPPIVNRERIAITQNDGSLDHVLKLANIARPTVCLKQLKRLARSISELLARFLRVAGDQILD